MAELLPPTMVEIVEDLNGFTAYVVPQLIYQPLSLFFLGMLKIVSAHQLCEELFWYEINRMPKKFKAMTTFLHRSSLLKSTNFRDLSKYRPCEVLAHIIIANLARKCCDGDDEKCNEHTLLSDLLYTIYPFIKLERLLPFMKKVVMGNNTVIKTVIKTPKESI